MFAPGVEDVMIDFHSTSTMLASFVVSVYVLGYMIGPFLIAPLSEIYGRVYLYHACNILFLIFTIACAVAQTMPQLIVFRLLAGTAGVCPLTIGSGTVADMVPKEKRAGIMAIWAMGPILGPVVGPVAGGFLAEAEGWRWVFWVIAIAVSPNFHFHNPSPANALTVLSIDRSDEHSLYDLVSRNICPGHSGAESGPVTQGHGQSQPAFSP